MSILDIFRTEKRSDELTDGFTPQSLDDILIPNSDNSITAAEAMNIPALDTSVSFISSIIATMPIFLYKRQNKTGERERVENDSRCYLLNVDTGDLLDPSQLKKALIMDYLLFGNGYLYLERAGNKVKSLRYINQSELTVTVNDDPIFKAAKYYIYGREIGELNLLRLTRKTKNGVQGVGVLNEHGLLLRSMYNSMNYENKTLGSGCKKGFLKSQGKLDKQLMAYLRMAWQKLVSSNNSDVMVLNSGIEFQEAGTTAVENQLTDNKKLNNSAVYSIFGLNDNLFEAATGGYDAFRDSVRTAITPIVKEIEIAMNRILLLESEKGDYFFKFDIDSVLESETSERYKNYELALKNSWLTVDDVRIKENLKPLGFNRLKLGLDAVLYDVESGQIYVPNTGIGTNINEPTPSNQNEPTKGGEN